MNKRKPAYKSYPSPDQTRVGCKVSWYYYRNRRAAEVAATAAKHNARVQEALGYDFGYCSPGSIEKAGKGWGPEYAGLWEVCLP